MHGRTAVDRGVARQPLLALQMAVIVIAVAAGCRTGGRTATSVTQQAVSAVRIGMTKSQTVATLGAPLVAGHPGGDERHEILAYAEPRVWHIAGRRLFGGGGVSFVVTLDADRLTEAYIADTSVGGSQYCACTSERCLPDWAKACLSLFPDGGQASGRQ